MIEMGARVSAPGLGRFLSVDPVEGGSANDYVYAFGDPVNEADVDGRGIKFDSWEKVKCKVRELAENLISFKKGNKRGSSPTSFAQASGLFGSWGATAVKYGKSGLWKAAGGASLAVSVVLAGFAMGEPITSARSQDGFWLRLLGTPLVDHWDASP